MMDMRFSGVPRFLLGFPSPEPPSNDVAPPRAALPELPVLPHFLPTGPDHTVLHLRRGRRYQLHIVK